MLQRFRVTAHVGIRRPIRFLVWAASLEEAARLAEDVPDALRPVIEARMRGLDVDPELRGWHNYAVALVEHHRGAAERLAEGLGAAGVTDGQLEHALARAVLTQEVEPDEAHALYGTAAGALRVARAARRAEAVREKRGRLGLAVALYRRGVRGVGEIAGGR